MAAHFCVQSLEKSGAGTSNWYPSPMASGWSFGEVFLAGSKLHSLAAQHTVGSLTLHVDILFLPLALFDLICKYLPTLVFLHYSYCHSVCSLRSKCY